MVRGAPASRVAKTPGWPSVGIRVARSKPASRSNRIANSQPSDMARSSAAMEGCRIHSCKRCTASSWRVSTSFRTRSRLAGADHAQGLQARVAALAVALFRKVRRFIEKVDRRLQPAQASDEDFFNDLAGDVRKPVLPAIVEVGQPFMVHAEEVEHGSMQVVHAGAILDGFITDFIGLAITGAAFDSGACHPGH